MNVPRCFARLVQSFVCFSLACCVVSLPVLAASKDDWRPVDPADLALKAPVVEKDADAEALFWDVSVADELDGGTPRTVLNHYIRIKVFTERGRESQSKIDIVFFGDAKIKDIAARTIKPDGSIVELKKGDVFERTIVRLSGLKAKAKSFAMPGVESGAIIEYRWREVRGDHLTSYERLQFQRDIPIQLVRYHIKPLNLPGFPYNMRVQTFHGQTSPIEKEKNGFYGIQMTKVPAFHEESRMPPEYEVRPWMLIFYSPDNKLAPDKYWKQFGKDLYTEYKSVIKPNDDVRKASAEIIGNATTPDEKLARLFEFCRTKIKNVNQSAAFGLSREAREEAKTNKSPADTIRRELGTGKDIDLLFASLAAAAGFDARFATLADRSDIFFYPEIYIDSYFLGTFDIAVRVADEWRFFDPGSTYVPYGMLLWQEEGQKALISDPKDPVFVKTPLSAPQKSLEKRTAKLRLSDDGTLEGDIRVEYTGHSAVDKKRFNDDDSPPQREENLRDQIKARMSTAELTDIHVENVTDPVKPFVYAYHVRVPGYAQRTGKRLFLQPAFFQHGAVALFPTSARRNDIYFHYPWSEQDVVEIELPKGFALDNADAPQPFTAANISKYEVKIRVMPNNRALVYERKFFFGGNDSILFPATSYATLKKIFDILHQQDDHTITLKQSATTAAN